MEFKLHIDETLRRPLYMQIRESIRQKISSGELKAGDRLPPESEIASELGVSLKIIRQALSPLVDEGLIYRRPQRGTFIGRKDPVIPNAPRTFNIGVVGHTSMTGWLDDIVRGVGDELSRRNYHMFVCSSDNDNHKEAEHVRSLVRKGVDGLIIFPVDQLRGQQHDYEHLNELQQARMPFVLIDRYIPHLETDYVVFDNYGGAYDATRYLIKLGHKVIGHLTAPLSITTTQARIRGFKDAMVAAGLHSSSDLVRYCGPGFLTEENATIELLEQGITALLCANPLHLLSAHDIITRQKGLRVPEDISLIGFAAPRDLEYIRPSVTVVSHPSYEIGKQAAEVLLAKICDGDNEVRRVVLKTQIIPGQSTSPYHK